MSKEYLTDVWRQKRDDEILQALEEIDAYKNDAKIVIQAEIARRGLTGLTLSDLEIEPEVVLPKQKLEGGGMVGCLAAVVVAVIISILQVMAKDETVGQWTIGGLGFFAIFVICLILWRFRNINKPRD